MEKYICMIYGHVYNPELGDPCQNIKPGIDFSSLPTDWQCPICGSSKDKFTRE